MVMGPAGEKRLPSLFRYSYLTTVFSILLFKTFFIMSEEEFSGKTFIDKIIGKYFDTGAYC